MSNKSKRIAIFKKCSRPASMYSENCDQVYFCPICQKRFPESSAVNGELTLEDVPPKSMEFRIPRIPNSNSGDIHDKYCQEKKHFPCPTQTNQSPAVPTMEQKINASPFFGSFPSMPKRFGPFDQTSICSIRLNK